AAPPNLRGTMNGHWNIELPEFDKNRMTVEGKYELLNVARFVPPAPTTSPAVAAALDTGAGGPRASTMPAAVQASHVSQVKGPAVVSVPATTGPVKTTLTSNTGRRGQTPTTQVALIPIADRIEGGIIARDGNVRLEPIVLRRKGGRADAKISFPLNAPRQMHVESTVAAWPVEYSAGRARYRENSLIWLQTELDADLKALTAKGRVANFRADVPIKQGQSIIINASANIDGRALDVTSIRGEGLGGEITGDGILHLGNPLQSSGRVDWRNVGADAIAALYPAVGGLAGRFSGSVRFSPTSPDRNPDATGPFALQGSVQASPDATLKGMHIGDADFIVYADYQRAVMQRLNWKIAGGELRAWTRVTWHDRDPFVHVVVDFDKLNLDEIVRAARPAGQEHKPVPGRVTGHAIAAANPLTVRGRKEASGEVEMRLTESDLVNVATVNLLYNVLSVKLGPYEPTGRGYIMARLEGERLEIPVVRYFNRGVDLWSNAAVVNVFLGANSPVEGTAAASARPLKDLKLPFMADVDQVLRALQGAVATASIQGTVGKPAPKVIPFALTGDAFRRFMLGEVRNEVRGTAGR
ncbi:MAG TPA: hypothetical protein VH475_27490, partial [Tepidisphaeraceae bacterium]